MKRILLLCVALAGCNVTGLKGECSGDVDCAAPSICLTTQSPHVCVLPQGQCFPACVQGQTCVGGVCKDVTPASIDLTSPGPNAFVGTTVQATATATAPGGVTSVRFEVRQGGVVVASATATAPISGSNFAASVDLSASSITDGTASIAAVVTYPTGTLASASRNINIDRAPPVLSMGSFDGRTIWMGPANTSVTVTATVTDAGVGVKASTVTLTLSNAKSYAGTAGASNQFSFTVPMADLGAATSVTFKIDASDQLGNVASLSGLATQVLQIDVVAPSVSIAADTTWYARTLAAGGANTIIVSATISDSGSDLVSDPASPNRPSLKVGTNPAVFGTSSSPNNWQFNLDATLAPTLAEGPLSFSITAQDNVGNVASVIGSRNVDDKAPVIANVSVVLSGTTTTPAAFFYSDTVDIKGEITDSGAGLSVSATQKIPSFELDGIAIGGGVSTVAPVAITGCTAGQQTKCTFLITGVVLRPTPFFASSGNMTLTIAADDLAQGGDGSAQRHHAVTSPLNVPVTRVKWSTAISALTSVSGLAVHTNGDVIVTGAGATATANTDTVFALLPDGTISWHQGTNFYGNNNEIGEIDGAPSIGAAATNPPVYVATLRRDFIGLSVTDGSNIWHCGTGQLNGVPHQPPTVVQASTGCEALIVGDGDGINHHINAACMNTSTSCTKSTNTNVNPNCGCHATSPAVNLGGTLYLGFNFANVGGGNDNGVTSAVFGPGVAFGTVTRFAPSGYNTVTNLSTDGTQIYGIDGAASQAYGMTAALANVWNVPTSAAVNGAAAIEPSSGGLIVNTNDSKLHALAQLDGSDTGLRTFASGNGNTPLLGSNGYMYFGNDLGAMLAVQDQAGYATAWSYSPGATPITVAPNMDCSGILYFAAGNTVYALITDSTGLRNSPWPKYQRDSRNSGNASASTLWGARVGGACTQ